MHAKARPRGGLVSVRRALDFRWATEFCWTPTHAGGATFLEADLNPMARSAAGDLAVILEDDLPPGEFGLGAEAGAGGGEVAREDVLRAIGGLLVVQGDEAQDHRAARLSEGHRGAHEPMRIVKGHGGPGFEEGAGRQEQFVKGRHAFGSTANPA